MIKRYSTASLPSILLAFFVGTCSAQEWRSHTPARMIDHGRQSHLQQHISFTRLPEVEDTEPAVIQLREILVPLNCARLKLPVNPVLRRKKAVELAKSAVDKAKGRRVQTIAVVTKLVAPAPFDGPVKQSLNKVVFYLPTSGNIYVPFIGPEGLDKYRSSVSQDAIAKMEVGDLVTLELRLVRSREHRIVIEHLDMIGADGTSLLSSEEIESRRHSAGRTGS